MNFQKKSKFRSKILLQEWDENVQQKFPRILTLKKDVSSALNRVPPPISSRLLLGVPPSLPLRGDVFYGWSPRQTP